MTASERIRAGRTAREGRWAVSIRFTPGLNPWRVVERLPDGREREIGAWPTLSKAQGA